MSTLPGVVQDAGIHVKGAPGQETLFLLDGFDLSGPRIGWVVQELPAGSDAMIDLGYGSNHLYTRQRPQGHEPYVQTPSGHSGNGSR